MLTNNWFWIKNKDTKRKFYATLKIVFVYLYFIVHHNHHLISIKHTLKIITNCVHSTMSGLIAIFFRQNNFAFLRFLKKLNTIDSTKISFSMTLSCVNILKSLPLTYYFIRNYTSVKRKQQSKIKTWCLATDCWH